MPEVSAGVTVPTVLCHLAAIFFWCTAVLERQRHRLGDTAKSEVVQGRPALYATRLGNFFL